METVIKISDRSARRLQQLADAPAKLGVRLLRVFDYENQITGGHIQQRYLSQRGPDTLGVVTNRLRSSIWASKARIVDGMLVASIGSNVAYLAPHEYGFDGPVQVRAFTRHAKALDQFRVVRLGAEFDPATGRITRRARNRQQKVASGIVRVKAHTRHVHYAERAPLRRGIADRLAALQLAVETAAVNYLGGAT